MRRSHLLFILLAASLSPAAASAATYPGNGNTGFGGAVGQGTLTVVRMGSDLVFTLQRGPGDLNDTVVFYLDTAPGGFADTTTLGDTQDPGRSAVSGTNGTDSADLSFPNGFEADYAIAFDAMNGGFLFGLAAGGPGSLNFVSALGGAGAATDASFTFTVALSDLGLTPKDALAFVVTYLNPATAFRSNEGIGDGLPMANPGNSPAAFTAPRPFFSPRINELRIDEPGPDNDEYVEFAGMPGDDLSGLTLIVIGDGAGGSGVLDDAVDLSGCTIGAAGLAVVAETTFTLGTPDCVKSLNFENSDNVTFLLVEGFTGMAGDDLDTNDDGVLDASPWSIELDRVALIEEENPPVNTEYHYGPPTVGPDGAFVPGAALRCPDAIGAFGQGVYELNVLDTPGTPNACPQAAVQGNGVEILDGDTTPDPSDGTDFGNVNIGASVAHTFSVQSLGNHELALIGMPVVEITGPGAAAFAVTMTPTTPVPTGSSTTFEITFAPTAAGTFDAVVRFETSDPFRPVFDFAIRGIGQTAPQPEIDVQGQGVSIPSGSTTPQASDGTDFGSAVVMGMAVTRTFTILNTGTDDLLLSGMPAVVLNGDPDFSVTVQPSSTVAPAASTTFEITFTPQSLGARTVTVQIENNDPDESPYTFVVGGAGTAAPEPEIDVTGNGTPIPSGSTVPTIDNGTEFGKAEVGTTSVTRTYAIQNLGSTALTLGTVTLSGDADFAVTSQPQATLAPGESTTLDVTFTPMMAGLRAATVEIPNNDADENPYTFAIQGTGTVAAPEIEVSGLGQPIASGSTMPEVGNGTDFGTTTAGSMPLTRTFTIANQGTAPLNLTGMPLVELSGDPVFTVTAEPTTPVQPTGSTTFVIEFAPTDAGTFSATVSIANDDADENPYTFAITGTATASNQPEIAVAGNGIEIVSGDSTPDAADGTDFGEVELGSSRVQSFTISNTGSAPLTLTADPPVAVTGTEFVVVTPPQTQIAAGESTTFQIEFTPVTAGRVTETVTIESDDSDEGSYVFTLAGTGVEPQGGTCGDGVVDAGEACDDGNTASGDGCAGDCSAIDDGWYCETEGMACTTSCGDGIVAGSEVCDDGAGNSDTQAGACRSDCSGVVPGQKKEEPGCGCGAAGGGSGGWVFALSAFGLALSRRRRRCP